MIPRLPAPALVPVLLACLAAFPIPRTRAETYQWVDKQGTVHFTDNPDELPEPMRSKVLQQLREQRQREEAERKAHGDTPPADATRLPDGARQERLLTSPGPVPAIEEPPAAAPPVVPQPTQTREHWQKLLQDAKLQVEALQKRCQELEVSAFRGSAMGGLLGPPSEREQGLKAAGALDKCKADLEAARKYVEEGLPEKARRAGVPPGWLR